MELDVSQREGGNEPTLSLAFFIKLYSSRKQQFMSSLPLRLWQNSFTLGGTK